jgi:hypothetical protein
MMCDRLADAAAAGGGGVHGVLQLAAAGEPTMISSTIECLRHTAEFVRGSGLRAYDVTRVLGSQLERARRRVRCLELTSQLECAREEGAVSGTGLLWPGRSGLGTPTHWHRHTDMLGQWDRQADHRRVNVLYQTKTACTRPHRIDFLYNLDKFRHLFAVFCHLCLFFANFFYVTRILADRLIT